MTTKSALKKARMLRLAMLAFTTFFFFVLYALWAFFIATEMEIDEDGKKWRAYKLSTSILFLIIAIFGSLSAIMIIRTESEVAVYSYFLGYVFFVFSWITKILEPKKVE